MSRCTPIVCSCVRILPRIGGPDRAWGVLVRPGLGGVGTARRLQPGSPAYGASIRAGRAWAATAVAIAAARGSPVTVVATRTGPRPRSQGGTHAVGGRLHHDVVPSRRRRLRGGRAVRAAGPAGQVRGAGDEVRAVAAPADRRTAAGSMARVRLRPARRGSRRHAGAGSNATGCWTGGGRRSTAEVHPSDAKNANGEQC
jgi:hypothetical protein